MAAFALVAGLITSPLLALYCGEGNAAAMACCQGNMDECNQPGQTQDCCRDTATDQESAGNAVKVVRMHLPEWTCLLVTAVIPDEAVVPRLDTRASLRLRSLQVLQDLPPPSPSVLRI